MSALLLLRLADVAALSASIGFLSAVAWRQWRDGELPGHRLALYLSWLLLAVTAVAEVQLSIHADVPFSWRTALVTTAAAAALVSASWNYLKETDGL